METTTTTTATTAKNAGQQNDSSIRSREEKNITDQVLQKILLLEANGQLKLPQNYSAENALKFAFLILQETVDKNDKPVLESCTKISIANALLKMVVQGLNPGKMQCYFIAKGGKLYCDRSYFGTLSVAKRVAGLKEINAVPIYQKDDFEYEYNEVTGRLKIIKHKPSIDNIDISKIKGGYATYILQDGTTNTIVMTMPQIIKAWEMGAMKGKSGAHQNFTDQMVERTVINRACKKLINSSDDADLYTGEEDKEEGNKMDYIPRDANSQVLEFEEVPNNNKLEESKLEPIEINQQSNTTTGSNEEIKVTEKEAVQSEIPLENKAEALETRKRKW